MSRRLQPSLLLALALIACQPAAEPVTSEPSGPDESQEPIAAPIPADELPTPAPVLDIEIPPSELLHPEDLRYLGAFRLPDGAGRPLTFEYGGEAITFNPAGDPGGETDGFSGSLIMAGHNRMPYGELPDGNQLAELSIPAPLISEDVYALPQASYVQGFHEVTGPAFAGLDEIPRMGLLYLDASLTGPLLHISWGQHLNPDRPFDTHAWVSPDLANPALQGPWSLDAPVYSSTGYLIEIPAAWAETYIEGRAIGAGRYRDGGWSGLGPSLYAYRPWDDAGQPAPAGDTLDVRVLLQYGTSYATESFDQGVAGYQHADEWEGAAWVVGADARTALLFAGTKSNGEKHWYGYQNPAGPDIPCVEVEMLGEFTLCRMADGSACPPEDFSGCEDITSLRGWWSSHYDATILFYDPADLARVAAGQMQPWEPQPYAALDIDEHLFLNPDGIEPEMLGRGDQQRYRIGEMAYDRANGRLYVMEWFAEGAKPVIHIWQIGG